MLPPSLKQSQVVRAGHVLRWLCWNKCHMVKPCTTSLGARAELIHSKGIKGREGDVQEKSQLHPISEELSSKWEQF